jgi:hypothetical protein
MVAGTKAETVLLLLKKSLTNIESSYQITLIWHMGLIARKCFPNATRYRQIPRSKLASEALQEIRIK